VNFLLASGNAHKAEEFKELFSGILNISASPQTLEVDETGETYTENAFLKAKAYFDIYKIPTLADDSGLTVEGLPDILGVKSARFAPELKSYEDKCKLLLQMLSQKKSSRTAYFTCVLCFYLAPDEVFFFEGRVLGKIGDELRGSKGFGYDPIFIPDRKEDNGMSLAELPKWKNEFSHRAKASQTALHFFKESMDKSHKKP